MGKTCVVKKCRSGYRSEKKKNVNLEPPKLYRFPKKKERYELWKTKVGQLGNVNEKSCICEKHFTDDDFKPNVDNKKRRRLTREAFPSKFGTQTNATLSTPQRKRKTILASSSEKRLKVTMKLNRAKLLRKKFRRMKKLAKRRFDDQQELLEKESKYIPSGVSRHQDDENGVITYYAMSFEKDPHVKYSVKIASDLSVKVFLRSLDVTEKYSKASGMNSWIYLVKLFASLEVRYNSATPADEVSIIVNMIERASFGDTKQAIFLQEQLSLIQTPPTGRRYSASLLTVACMLERTSPACYRQLLREGILTLPSVKHLRRLTSAIKPDFNLSETALAYIRAKYKKLKSHQKTISLIMDEVHAEKDAQYSNGKIYGIENGAITKSLLTVMIKSLVGKYHDVLCMSPIDNIDSTKIEKVWRNCVKALTEIGFSVKLTVVDGLDANVKFYKSVSDSSVPKPVIPNPSSPSNTIALAHDTTHLFKNIYNNLNNYGSFTCPSWDEEGVEYTAQFSHVCELFALEATKPVRIAHKLSHKVLNPSSLEKTNVKLADSFFHQSTINGLNYYAKRGYPEFSGTAKVFQIIRDWFDTVNVKSLYNGQRTKNNKNNKKSAITKENFDSVLSYLKKFQEWVERWQLTGKQGLSRQTFGALIQTLKAIPHVVRYLLDEVKADYVFLGFFSSDFLEARFGWYRQLCGGNYFNNALKFLEAEKSIQVRSLIQIGYSMTDVKELFAEANAKQSKRLKEEIDEFIFLLSDYDFSKDLDVDDADRSATKYYAGYIVRSFSRAKSQCEDC